MIESFSVLILPLMILIILIYAAVKKVPVYEEFIEGAKDGFKVSISIIPYLVALIVAVTMFRYSGAMDWLAVLINPLIEKLSISADIIPLIITRPLSGSAALGLFSEIATKYGPDDFITKLSAILIGSSETTFYVLTVYFGSIGIKKFRYALWIGILSDIISVLLAIFVARLFFLASSGM